MIRIVAYACSTRPNALWSADQFDNAAPKNRTECDIPLVALSDLEAERQRSASLKAMRDEMAKEARRQALEEAEKAIGEHPGITYTNHRGNTDWRLASRQDFIDAIRALSESSPNPLPEQIANIGKEGE
jgi:hypothetical protein